jgi:hypothetical protein
VAVTDEDVESVQGAFRSPDLQLFRVLLEATAQVLDGGDLAEFGVLHGRSAVLIGDYTGPDDQFTVVDLFGALAEDVANQQENADYYPDFDQGIFESNYRRFHAVLPRVVRGPSHTIADEASHGTHRFVHVDASHLYRHVAADIDVAKLLLKPDGVLVLDDYRSEHTPGVAAAAWQAVLTSGLRPFAVSPHKMYATWGDPGPWAEAVRRWAEGSGHGFETQEVKDAPLIRVEADSWTTATRHPYKRFVPELLWPAAKRVRGLADAARRRG